MGWGFLKHRHTISKNTPIVFTAFNMRLALYDNNNHFTVSVAPFADCPEDSLYKSKPTYLQPAFSGVILCTRPLLVVGLRCKLSI